MLMIKRKLFYIIVFTIVYLLNSTLLISDNLNECIKNAVQNKVQFNKILTLCRDNIKAVDIYSNDFNSKNIETSSEYISTNKTDKLIHELIKEGNLSKASRLTERQEIEKTKRIKARAEAEALRAPQIIATNSNNQDKEDSTNVRSILSLGANPIVSISAGSKVLEITTPGVHGAIPGQFVTLSNVLNSIDGIAAAELNKTHIISSVPTTTTFRISVLSSASSGSVSGGGTDIIATFQN